MRTTCVLTGFLLLGGHAVAQEEETTRIETRTEMVAGGADLLRENWFVDDATVIGTGQIDLRVSGRWLTANAPANNGDSDDDWIFTPSIAWGIAENIEVFAEVPIWLGDSGDRGAFEEGNADTNIGFTWRMMDQVDLWPAVALRTTARTPTGDRSDGVDGEVRLILTNDYDSGIRSHVNAFAIVADGLDDQVDRRHFQWGFVFGLDGPLSSEGDVRWVVDYMHRSSHFFGRPNINIAEVGWEWAMSGAQKLGMSVQVGLDGGGDTPNLGAAFTYAHSLTY